MINHIKYNLVNDLGFVKTGVDYYSNLKKYFSTGSIKENIFTPEGSYDYKLRPSRANREVFEGDVLQARMQNTNKIILVDKNLHGNLFSTGFFQFRPPKELVIPRYLYYFLSSDSFLKRKDKLCEGSTQKAINDRNLKKIDIFLPPLAEQKCIVAKLDKAFEEINKLERVQKNKISLFNQIKKSILSSIIIDELKKKEVKLIKLKEVVSYEKKNGQGSGLPYVGMEDISSDSMMLVNAVKVPLNTSTTFLFNSSHILYGRLRPYLKKILIPNFSGQCSTELFCIKPEKFLDRKFLAYWLLTPEISDKINKTSTGTRMPRANMNDLLEFEIQLPEHAQQKKIVKKIEGIFNEIESLISNSEILLENYEALQSSILRQELQQENIE